MLEQSVVFRQLEGGGRFSRFDFTDLSIVLVAYAAHYELELALGGYVLRAMITLVCAGIFVWFLRTWFPEGVGPLIHVLVTPRHLSSMAPDRILRRYPPASQRERPAR